MSNSTREVRCQNLHLAAKKRKDGALERAERAVRKLLMQNESVTFAKAAREAGVSVAFLYKYPELKARIQQLRAEKQLRGSGRVKPPPVASDGSKQVIIAQLRKRVKALEAELRDQKKHVEALSGQLFELHGDKALAARLREENAKLSQRALELAAERKQSPPPLLEVPERIRKELARLDIRLTASIRTKIISGDERQVLNALRVVDEVAASGKVRSKSGLFLKALQSGWEPGDASSERKAAEREFAAWFDAARKKGLVRASRGTDGGILVFTTDGKWAPYELLQNRAGWSLQELLETD